MRQDADTLKRRIGRNVLYLRTSHDLTQVDLASLLGYEGVSNNSYISRVESGDKGVSVETLCELSELFGINIHRLVYEELQATRPNPNL